MSEISSEKSERQMPVTIEESHRIMRGAIDDCAFPLSAGEKMKTWLPRVARSVGIAANRLYDIYIGETVPRWHEGEAIRQKAQEQKARWADIARRQSIAELKTDIQRTREYGAEIARRQEVSRRADLDRQPADDTSQFHFWLGRPDSDMDRED